MPETDTQPIVLIVCEGGLVQETINIRGDARTVELDWDILDGGELYEIDDAIARIEPLPAAAGFDKQGILDTLHRHRDELAAATADD